MKAQEAAEHARESAQPRWGTELSRANHMLASLTFGVPESEIEFTLGRTGWRPGKINLDASFANDPTHRTPRGAHGTEGRSGGFEPGKASVLAVNADELANASGAQSVLFHEVSHLQDYELTQRMVARAISGRREECSFRATRTQGVCGLAARAGAGTHPG